MGFKTGVGGSSVKLYDADVQYGHLLRVSTLWNQLVLCCKRAAGNVLMLCYLGCILPATIVLAYL